MSLKGYLERWGWKDVQKSLVVSGSPAAVERWSAHPAWTGGEAVREGGVGLRGGAGVIGLLKGVFRQGRARWLPWEKRVRQLVSPNPHGATSTFQKPP